MDHPAAPVDAPTSTPPATTLATALPWLRWRGSATSACYNGQAVRLVGSIDDLEPIAMAQVIADLFRRLGLSLDVAVTDWGTMLQGRNSRAPVAQGGWSVFCTAFSSIDVFNPIGHLPLRGNGAEGWPGWSDVRRMEAVRDAWFEAPDDAERKRICEDMQRLAMDELPSVPLGCFYSNTALRRDLADRVPGLSLFWNIRRA